MSADKGKFPLLSLPKSLTRLSNFPLLQQGMQLRRNVLATARSIDLINWDGTPYGTHPRQVLNIQEVNDLCPRDGWPTVLMIHGGGWIEGDKEQYKTLMPLFSRKRIMPVSMNYRLAPENRWPAQLEDIHAAIDFLKKQQIDLQRLALWGFSAGGQLALMAALERDDICAVVTIGAPTDISTMNREDWQDCFSEEDLKASSPLFQDKKSLPPTMMLHGALDQVVPVSNCKRFAEKHPSVKSVIIENGNHGIHWPPLKAQRAKKEAFNWLVDAMDLPHVGSKWKRKKKKKS
jgi:acetyl esterase/lipase